jgi:hypothetical protein
MIQEQTVHSNSPLRTLSKNELLIPLTGFVDAAERATPDSSPDALSLSGIRLFAVFGDFFPIYAIVLGLPKVNSPRVSNSIATINERIPIAIMKLEMVTPSIIRIVVPAIANTSNNIPVVITSLEETTLLSWFDMFLADRIHYYK